MAKFILGGRMGDLIHMMYVVAHTPGGPHDLYITDRRDLHSDGFIYDLDRTIEELRPVLMYQDYVKSVQAYNNESDCVNLNLWREKAYSDNWTVLLSKMFNVPMVGDAWMKWRGRDAWYNVTHCSLHPARSGDWGKVPRHSIGWNIHIGNNFVSLSELFTIIARSIHFYGEQSLPLAIAHALDVPRIGVLNHVDAKAYIGEELIFKKFSYVL